MDDITYTMSFTYDALLCISSHTVNFYHVMPLLILFAGSHFASLYLGCEKLSA